ncbi:sulfate adenylyltransferase subunit CysD [Rhodococcus sp. 3Y1]
MTVDLTPSRPQLDGTQFDTLDALEVEAIHIFREVAGEFERPVILFSGGKDSTVLLHLAIKAFWPAPLPFTLLHVDTGHNLQEVLDFRDHVVAKYNLRLHVASVEEYIADGRLTERPDGIRNPLQTVPLLDAISENRFDAVFGGARRDEGGHVPRSGSSHCATLSASGIPEAAPGAVEPLQRSPLPGEQVRVFPLSNFTELDIWRYIARDNVELASIYYAHQRPVYQRDGMWMTPESGVGRLTAKSCRPFRCVTAPSATVRPPVLFSPMRLTTKRSSPRLRHHV